MSLFAVTRWWLVRHAPVDNPGGVIYGRTDLPAVFEDQPALAWLAASLPKDPVYIASPLLRSVETLRQLHRLRPVLCDEDGAGTRGAKNARENIDANAIERVPELAEQDFGDWEGRLWSDIPADQARLFWDDFANAVPPGGESFSQLADRVVTAFNRLNQLHAGRDIVAVLHGGPIRAILAHILALAPGAALAFDIAPLGLTRIDYLDAPENPGWRIDGVNLRRYQG
ncbi:histidine phosphatase family protein [Thalassospira sp. TSL5-1]|uniref:histidine phosphatase family protein n=1 Tax=Thalassospira sp. TSL5-1 TaxID=1544451 RepID=UPI000A9D42FD|nr:histidine phosphatase family protein [Thalassospira sp. TSL5-1]